MRRVESVVVAMGVAALISFSAHAEEPSGDEAVTEASSGDSLGELAANGFALKIDLIRRALGANVGSNGPLATYPALAPGLHTDRLSLLLGLSFTRVSSSSAVAYLGLQPTVHIFLTEPRVYRVSPYLIGEFDYLIPFGQQLNSSDATVGFALGAGGIFLVNPHFGVSAEGNLRYAYRKVTSTAVMVGTPSMVSTPYAPSDGTSVLALEGVASLVLFF